jgi:hypothetical protein
MAALHAEAHEEALELIEELVALGARRLPWRRAAEGRGPRQGGDRRPEPAPDPEPAAR